MLGFYTPLLILQGLCLYHAYRNNVEQRWYWFIIFFPGIGCLLYLYHNFYNRGNIQSLSEGVKTVINSNYKIEQLEKQLRFVDNIANKTNLADAYITVGRHQEAADLYKDCLTGFMADDPDLRMKALRALFLNKDYDGAIAFGEGLETEKTFKNSEARIAYAWSQHRAGNTDKAEKIFQDLNKSFTNYRHRLAYCHFLKETQNATALKEVLGEMLEEFEHMKAPERRLHRGLMNEVREFRM